MATPSLRAAAPKPIADRPRSTASKASAGVYDIRLIVLGKIMQHPRNARWEPFSADVERIRQGARHYAARRRQAERLLDERYLRFQLEGSDMSCTMADFMRASREHLINNLTPEPLTSTLERALAQTNDDLTFVGIDHPLVARLRAAFQGIEPTLQRELGYLGLAGSASGHSDRLGGWLDVDPPAQTAAPPSTGAG